MTDGTPTRAGATGTRAGERSGMSMFKFDGDIDPEELAKVSKTIQEQIINAFRIPMTEWGKPTPAHRSGMYSPLWKVGVDPAAPNGERTVVYATYKEKIVYEGVRLDEAEAALDKLTYIKPDVIDATATVVANESEAS